eukprot:5775145-Lingulodinium_polyedra.AAC.1
MLIGSPGRPNTTQVCLQSGLASIVGPTFPRGARALNDALDQDTMLATSACDGSCAIEKSIFHMDIEGSLV